MTMVCDPDNMFLFEDDFDHVHSDLDGLENEYDNGLDDLDDDTDFPFFNDDVEFDVNEQEIIQEFEAAVDERWSKYEIQERQPLRKMKIHDHQNNKPNKRKAGHSGKQAVQEACWA